MDQWLHPPLSHIGKMIMEQKFHDLLLLELVGAEDGEARLGLLGGEALPAAFETLEDLLDGDVLLPCIANRE